MRPRLLGQPIPARGLAFGAAVVLLTLCLRLVYPLATVFFGAEHNHSAAVLIASSIVLSVARALAALECVAEIRHVLFDALTKAIHRFPILVSKTLLPPEQIENEISRGIPWTEAYFAESVPSVIGSMLAVPIVAIMAARYVGAHAVLLGIVALAAGVGVGALLGNIAGRRGDAAWDYYQRVATLIEQGIVGRAELRVHQLGRRHRMSILERVDGYTAKMRRVRLLQAVTNWSVPIVAASFALLVMWGVGYDPAVFLGNALVEPRRAEVLAGALGLTALPIMINISNGLSAASAERPYRRALERFVAAATACESASVASVGELGVISVNAEYEHEHDENEPAVRIAATLRWCPDESLAVMGPNGSGKSTLSLLLMGLIQPTRGTISVESARAAAGVEALAGRISYLPQGAYFDDAGSVREALRFVAPNATDDASLHMLSELLGSAVDTTFLDRASSSLSAGQRRIVALARVLLRGSDVTILDEPEANLDVGTRQRVIALLRRASRDTRLMVLTHDAEFSAAADRIVRFDDRHRLREEDDGTRTA